MDDSSQLTQLGMRLLPVDRSAALMCLDRAFSEPLDLQNRPIEEIEPLLRVFLAYCQELRRLIYTSDISCDDALHKLLAFSSTDSGEYLVRRDSLLWEDTASKATETVQRRPLCQLVSSIRAMLKQRLLGRVRAENDACKKYRGLTVCLQHAIEGRCTIRVCLRSHIGSFDRSAFCSRVRLLALQILIYQTLANVEDWQLRQPEHRYVPSWL
jgi:hypothetical protein